MVEQLLLFLSFITAQTNYIVDLHVYLISRKGMLFFIIPYHFLTIFQRTILDSSKLKKFADDNFKSHKKRGQKGLHSLYQDHKSFDFNYRLFIVSGSNQILMCDYLAIDQNHLLLFIS